MLMSWKKKFAWVPNLFTLGNLSLGFFSILLSSSSQGNSDLLKLASALIILAALADGLDGWAARLLNARSELGAQLDSLADLATFGLAPGVLMYSLLLKTWNLAVAPSFIVPTGMMIAAIFPACAAYRLARFNVSHDDSSFAGLPSPIAGITIALMPFIFPFIIVVPEMLLVLLFVFTAFLMVSTVKYAKPQVSFLRKMSPLRFGIIIFFIVIALVVVYFNYGAGYSAAGLFSLIIIYVITGIISLIIHSIQQYRI